MATLQYDPAHFNRYFEDKECKYNAGTKTEYSSPPSSAGPQPPTASTGKTSSAYSSIKKIGTKNSSTADSLDFVPLVTAVDDERSDEAVIKCEMSSVAAAAAAATFHYANVEIWSDKRLGSDNNDDGGKGLSHEQHPWDGEKAEDDQGPILQNFFLPKLTDDRDSNELIVPILVIYLSFAAFKVHSYYAVNLLRPVAKVFCTSIGWVKSARASNSWMMSVSYAPNCAPKYCIDLAWESQYIRNKIVQILMTVFAKL